MHLKFTNVNQAFRFLVEEIHEDKGVIETRRTTSRNGDVIQVVDPIILTYMAPVDRVLFNQARDANPFFHLMESLWMLAGRNDLAPLKYYVSTFDQFSDDGKILNGAYGYRWRRTNVRKNLSPYHNMNGLTDKQQKTMSANSSNGIWGNSQVDQLEIIADHLIRMPDSRRAVLSMWNVEDDLMKIGSDLDFMQGKISKDVCCNLSCTFQIRDGELDMTVFNRSNDLVWGSLGANVVHFSVLLEYMAAKIGVQVGRYHQVSTNLHVYTKKWEPEKWLADTTPDYYDCCSGLDEVARPFPLVQDIKRFDEELPRFVEQFVGKDLLESEEEGEFSEPFFVDVAFPAAWAFSYHKARRYSEAIAMAEHIQATDWRIACVNWLKVRQARHLNRNPYLEMEMKREQS